MRQWIDVPKSILSANKPDAVMILRLGAFSNAVQTVVQQLVLALTRADTAAAERDRMHLFLASVGYLKEAVDHVQQHQPRLRQLLNLARKQGYDCDKWQKIAPLLTTQTNSLHQRVLDRVRNDVGFHFKKSVFERWIDVGASDTVRLWDVHGSTNAGRLYRASSDALAYALAEGREAADELVRDSVADIGEAQFMLMKVAEAALIGFITSAGHDPREYYHTGDD